MSFIFAVLPFFASVKPAVRHKSFADVTHAAISEELQESEPIFPLNLLLKLSARVRRMQASFSGRTCAPERALLQQRGRRTCVNVVAKTEYDSSVR